MDQGMHSVQRVTSKTALVSWQQYLGRCYQEMGFLSEDECPGGIATDKYDQCALHFFANRGDAVSGTFRLVPYTEVGLPMEEVFDLSQVADLHQLFEVTRLTAHRKGGFLEGIRRGAFTRSILFPALCYSVAFARINDKRGFIAMIDPIMFVSFNNVFNNTMQPIPGLEMKYYKGGWVTPVRVDVRQFEAQVVDTNSTVAGYLKQILPDEVSM